jgi:hypothetical protein
MDKSSNYIRMCEGIEEIQEQWQPEFEDFYVSISLGLTSPCQPIMSDLEKKVSYLKTIKAVWLPRQDQLQEMVIENYATFWDLAIAFSNVLIGENASYFEKFASMEKLWLAFIMLEKHKRKWNDGEWL